MPFKDPTAAPQEESLSLLDLGVTLSSIVSTLMGAANTGLNFQANSTNSAQPTTLGEANNAYNTAQTGLANQAGFLQAVQAQNGLGNQSSVYNQLQNVANGTGANPAQAMLNQSTQANVSNQAALMAGQRGSSANAGLMARQAAQQGAGLQQQAAGQAASMQANQSLNALNNMGGLATNQANQQANATNAYNSGAQGEQGLLLNSVNAQNSNNTAMQSNQNSVNAQIQGQAASGQMNMLGNLAGAAGSALLLADGGQVGTEMDKVPASGPQSKLGQYLSDSTPGLNNAADPLAVGSAKLGTALGTGLGNGIGAISAALTSDENPGQEMLFRGQSNAMASGGKVPVLLSPGEKVLDPKKARQVAEGKASTKDAKIVPGKPKVGGAKNDYANDTYRTSLASGSIVIPRSETQSKDSDKREVEFVRAHLAKRGLKAVPSKAK